MWKWRLGSPHMWRGRLCSPVKTKHRTCKVTAENDRQHFQWWDAIRHSLPSGSYFASCCHCPSWLPPGNASSLSPKDQPNSPLLWFTLNLQSYFSLSFTVCASMLSRFSHVQFFATLRTVAHQAPLSMGFSRQEHWSRLPCPPPGYLPNPGIKPVSLTSYLSCTGRWVLHH